MKDEFHDQKIRSAGQWKKYYYQRKEAGLCVQGCGRPPTRKSVRCQPCRDRLVQYKKHWASMGLCRYGCGNQTNGEANVCRDCRRGDREKDLRKLYARYGLTVEQYNKKKLEQNSTCAICDRPDTSKNLAVDHHHSEGYVRDLLCGRCNTSLGQLLENPVTIRRLAEYIEHHNVHKGTVPFRSRA